MFFKERTVCIFIFILVFSTHGLSQHLENIKSQQPLKINGFLSTNQVFSSNTKDIYTGYYTGNMNFDIYGVQVPFTFVYSSQKTNFSHPFNQFGLHPSWKWIRVHAGYGTMTFSPYSLRGILFFGGGVELTPPGLFHCSAMYGRLARAREGDTAGGQLKPVFRRMGYGFKAGMGRGKNFADLNFFQAADDPSSLSVFPDSSGIMPEANTVVSLNAGAELFKHVMFSGEIASSAITGDIRSEVVSEKPLGWQPALWFMPPRSSTICRRAVKANLTYALSRFSFGAGYERVDPDFTTFGAYYFTNNMENYTVNASVNFFENKVSLSGNTGLQKDNLNKTNMNNNRRFVGSMSTTITPGERFNLNASYSNFTSYTNVRSTFDYINQTTPYQHWDTLNYRQISQSINASSSYQLSAGKDRRQTIAAYLTCQTSGDQAGSGLPEKSRFYNAGVSYTLGLAQPGMNIIASMNYNRNELTGTNTSTWGPAVTVSKMLLDKKMRTHFSCAWNTSFAHDASAGHVMNFRAGIAYTIRKHHHVNLNALHQWREHKGMEVEIKRYATATVTLGYVYNFSLLDNKKRNDD